MPENTREIYAKNDIEYVYVYQILTDTDSTSLQFLIICNEKSTKNDREYRDVIFDVTNSNDVFKRFDTSTHFGKNLTPETKKLEKN